MRQAGRVLPSYLALKEKPDFVTESVGEWVNSSEFNKHTRSDASNNRLKVFGRLEYVRDKLLGK